MQRLAHLLWSDMKSSVVNTLNPCEASFEASTAALLLPYQCRQEACAARPGHHKGHRRTCQATCAHVHIHLMCGLCGTHHVATSHLSSIPASLGWDKILRLRFCSPKQCGWQLDQAVQSLSWQSTGQFKSAHICVSVPLPTHSSPLQEKSQDCRDP